MNNHNINLKKLPWPNKDAQDLGTEIFMISHVDFYGGGTGSPKREPENTDEEAEVDKSVIDKMNARRGPGDSNKADSGGGDADKRVVSRDVDNGPINNDRGA